MKNSCLKKRVYLTLSKQDHERLARMALETGRTVPGYIRWLIYQHFAEKYSQNKNE